MWSGIFQSTAIVKNYEPAERIYHQAAAIGGNVYMWGGSTSDLPQSFSSQKARRIEMFDHRTETWKHCMTEGAHHPGVYSVACTSFENNLFAYGGNDTMRQRGILSKLNVDTLTWSKLSKEVPDGPMAKWECGIVYFHGGKLAVFGGYGLLPDSIQSGAQYISGPNAPNLGWTNELHIFDLGCLMWSSPSMSGSRPPPCRNFSFTSIDKYRALLFGGFVPEGMCRVNHLYLFDFRTMVITRIEPMKGQPLPVGRACHAACCLGFNSECPQLLVIGGGTTDSKTLKDAWMFDIQTKTWKEVILPDDTLARSFFVATSVSLVPGYEEVTIFGGSSKFRAGISIHEISKLANTTLLIFEQSDLEWVLVKIVSSDQLGKSNRVREKVDQICKVASRFDADGAKANRSQRNALQIAQAKAEKDRALQQVRRLEELLAGSRERERAAEARIQEAQEVQERMNQIADEELSQAEERVYAAEKRSHSLEQRSHDAERRSRIAEQRCHHLEQKLHEAEQRATDTERRLHELEQRVRGTEQKARAQIHEENHWVVPRGEIEFTEEEIGRGGWAAVKVANFRGAKVAAKCFYQEMLVSQYNRQLFNREMNMAARLRHPNLVQFIGASLEGEPIILTELMTTSLRAVLESGPIDLAHTISITLDVVRALNYLHLMKPNPIIHRDISSANVLLDPLPDNRWKAKVSDYGSVNILQQLQTIGPGSPAYAAPEASIPALQSPKMDVYSFGILLVEMLTDQFPEIDSRQRLIALIDHNGFSRLIRQCLSEETDQRPSANELITEITDIEG